MALPKRVSPFAEAKPPQAVRQLGHNCAAPSRDLGRRGHAGRQLASSDTRWPGALELWRVPSAFASPAEPFR